MHTERGMDMIKHFLVTISAVKADWTMDQVLEQQLQKIAELVGPEGHAICALSGGVDSTVAATLVHKVLGDRLHCVFVDNGLLRYKVSDPSVIHSHPVFFHGFHPCYSHCRNALCVLPGAAGG